MSVLLLRHLLQALPVNQMSLECPLLFRLQFVHGLHKPVPLAIKGGLIDRFPGVNQGSGSGRGKSCEGVLEP